MNGAKVIQFPERPKPAPPLPKPVTHVCGFGPGNSRGIPA